MMTTASELRRSSPVIRRSILPSPESWEVVHETRVRDK
jgi:hypothetical protein